MKIVIGTANFNQNYGLINSKIKNSNEVKKILDYCRKKKNYLLNKFFLN